MTREPRIRAGGTACSPGTDRPRGTSKRVTQGIQSLSGGIDLPSPEPTEVDLRNQTLNDVAKETWRQVETGDE